jgi:methylenetetrahydrofolate reductase (NADPH)
MSLSIPQLEEARRALEAPLYADLAGDAEVSFEFFPPKSAKMERRCGMRSRRSRRSGRGSYR